MQNIQVILSTLSLDASQREQLLGGCQLAWPAIKNRVSLFTYYLASVFPEFEVRKTRDQTPIRLIPVDSDSPFKVTQVLLETVSLFCQVADEQDELNYFQLVVTEPVVVAGESLIYCNVYGAGVRSDGVTSVVR